jgi:hypothetical protein
VRISPNEVDTCALDAVKSIYDTRETFKKSAWYSNLAAVNSPVLFSITDVDAHRRLRRLLAAQTTESSLKALIPLVEERVELYVQRIKQDLNNHGVIDVFKWNLFLATDVIGEVSFGKSFRLLESGKVCYYSSTHLAISQTEIQALCVSRKRNMCKTWKTLDRWGLFVLPSHGWCPLQKLFHFQYLKRQYKLHEIFGDMGKSLLAATMN